MLKSISANMYEGAIHALIESGEEIDPILQGLLCTVCHMGSTVVAVYTKIISPAVEVLLEIASKAWSVVKEVTGFVWSTLVAAANNSNTWAAVLGAGAAVATVNPLVGGLVAALGAVGLLLTSNKSNNQEKKSTKSEFCVVL